MLAESDRSKGRSLHTNGNLTSIETALDDISMEEDLSPCKEGSTIERGCEEVCSCVKGKLDCKPRCTGALVRPMMTPVDPHCIYRPTEDKCCSTLVCSNTDNDAASEGRECVFKNATYNSGQTFYDECTSTCSCNDGEVSCKPRCTAYNRTANFDRCLTLPDPKDPCCTILYCDVNASDDLGGEEDRMEIKLVSAVPANSTSLSLNLDSKNQIDQLDAEISKDQTNWTKVKSKGQTVTGLEPGSTYYLRVLNDGVPSNVVSATLPKISSDPSVCLYKEKSYKIGEEFHDDCKAYCQCLTSGVECSLLNCPSDFGLDVLDPQCVSWGAPTDFVPTPPNCCPESLICKNNGSCTYAGERFENWAEIPDKLTGCEETCFCANGNVTCRPRCPPVPPNPPYTLNCLPTMAILEHISGDNCCLHWICPAANGPSSNHPITGYPNYADHDGSGITVHTLEAIDENTVRLIFSVPSVLVGLHGRVELRYTSDNKNSDPSTWEQQVLAPPKDLIATKELEFELGNLQPATEYKIRITIVMRDLDNSPASQILFVKTPPAVSTTVPPVIPVEPELRVSSVNSTWATIEWRKFNENELQFIDGVQLRYKEVNGKVYQATPLIHRAVTSYTIEELKPDSQYEVGIFFIPFPGQTTELQSQTTVKLSTPVENDPYKFDLNLDVHHIKSNSVETTWSGVPYPVDKYINIIRIIYQDEGGRGDMSTFKVAKRDSPPESVIEGLKADTRYRLWLEAYLTNGRIKKSNVKDFTTKSGPSSGSVLHQGKLEGSGTGETANYYGALVGVSVVAGLASLAALGLVVALARNQSHHKAPISGQNQRNKAPHTAAYDNPSYKVDLHHETIGQ
ncbi:stranded at second transmembrane protein isoform X2 [Rhodnius prolixus]|uniref:stranded at second transmembrane protein isoform X2 n=1 Tax=Rhodnius prolixus TaxID=13249 RepID=UPI003D18DA35